MMPAQIVTAAVAMGADTRTQPHHLGDQFLPCQVRKIIVHFIALRIRLDAQQSGLEINRRLVTAVHVVMHREVLVRYLPCAVLLG